MKRHYLTENNAYISQNRFYKHIGLCIWGSFSVFAAVNKSASPSIGETATVTCQVTLCHKYVTCDTPNFG